MGCVSHFVHATARTKRAGRSSASPREAGVWELDECELLEMDDEDEDDLTDAARLVEDRPVVRAAPCRFPPGLSDDELQDLFRGLIDRGSFGRDGRRRSRSRK